HRRAGASGRQGPPQATLVRGARVRQPHRRHRRRHERGPVGRVQGHRAVGAAAGLPELPQEGRRATQAPGAGGSAARSAVRLHGQPVQDDVPQVEVALRRPAAGSDLAAEAEGAAGGDGAPGPQGRRQLQGDAAEGMEALEGGQPDRAMDAMQRALDKMRAQEESSRSGKNLKGGRESNRGNSAGRDRRGGEGGGPDDKDFGEGEGLLPGKGRSSSPKGEATQRLRGNPYDVGVEGESRRGRKDGYDTNMTGRAGQMGSRLQYLGVVGQYRKMMEDAIARESIPRDFHSQIKDYFQALDER